MAFSIIRTPYPEYVNTPEQVAEWKAVLRDAENGFGIDTETSGLDTFRDRVFFFSLAVEDRRCCVPVRFLRDFEEEISNPDIPKSLTNVKFDRHMIENYGIKMRGVLFDTADMDFLIDENRQGKHGLKACAREYLGLEMTPFSKIFGKVRSIDREVALVGEVHDLLELKDFHGKEQLAKEKALAIMLEIGRTELPTKLSRHALALYRAVSSGEALTRTKLTSAARALGLIPTTRGTKGYAADLMSLMGVDIFDNVAARKEFGPVVESEEMRLELQARAWEVLVDTYDVSDEDPVETLRLLITDYASLDAWASFTLVDVMLDDLANQPMVTPSVAEGLDEPVYLDEYYLEERVDFVSTLYNMERRGAAVDVAVLRDMAKEYTKILHQSQRAVVKVTGDLEFNPNSSKQLRDRLFTEVSEGVWHDPWGNEPRKFTDSKVPSTDAETLKLFASKGDPLAEAVLNVRKYEKLLGTYLLPIPEAVDRNDRIHTNFRAGGARTWRISASDPNLMNIPSRSDAGKRIRYAFIAGTYGDSTMHGHCLDELSDVPVPDLPEDFPMVLIVADYEQVEMRIMAHLSGDENMISAIRTDKDLHCVTVALASERGLIPVSASYEEIKAAKDAETPDEYQKELLVQRSNMKAVGFGIIYGIGALKLGMSLGLPIVTVSSRRGGTRDTCPAAEKLIGDYLHTLYPRVGQFIEDTHERCREEMVVYTVGGHPRRLPHINSKNRRLSSQAERQSVNSIIQGTAADFISIAMLKCERDRKLRKLGVRQLLQVHDELMFEVPDHPDFVKPAKKLIRTNMENPYALSVPIGISMDVARSWGEAK